MNLNKRNHILLSILFRRKVKVFNLVFVVILFNSCSSWISYEDKNGNNDIIIYEDSLLYIQRSTEVLGDELMISHLVTIKAKFSNANFLINDISDQIENLKVKDSFSYSCSYKKYWYKKFSEIPIGVRKLQECASYQIIYYYPTKDLIGNQIIISTNFDYWSNGKSYLVNRIDTLIKHKTYHMPQP